MFSLGPFLWDSDTAAIKIVGQVPRYPRMGYEHAVEVRVAPDGARSPQQLARTGYRQTFKLG